MLDSSQVRPVAVKLYSDSARTVEVGASDTLTISQKQGSVTLYPQFVYSDGTVANPARSEYVFSVDKTTDLLGNTVSTTLIACNQSGVMRATIRGNGFVTVKCAISGQTGVYATTRICITGNTPEIMSLDLSYVDDLYPSGVAYDEGAGRVPQIRERNGRVQLKAHVVFNTGLEGSPSDLGLSTSWEIISTEPLSGYDLPGGDIATVRNGYVFATGIGNGAVIVRCTVENYTIDARVEIRGNGEAWVTKVEVLDEDGNAYGDNSAVISDYYPLNLYARVTYSDGTVKNTYYGEAVPNLIWTSSDMVGATINPYSGQVVFDDTFRKGRIQAVVQGGGFYKQDVSRAVYVYFDAGYDQDEDMHSDTLTVRVVEESGYRESGIQAESVYEKVLSASYLSGFTQFVSYTFSKGPTTTGAFTARRYGVLFAEGVTLETVLSLAGVDTEDIVAFRFATYDNHNPKAFSPDEVLTSRNAYPNFTIGVENGNPSASGAYSVPTILALNSYIDYGGDIGDTTYDASRMSNKTQFRLCMGLSSVKDSNSYESAKYVSDVVLIVKDGTYDYGDGGGGDGGDGGGTGGGSGTGDGTGIGPGSGSGTGGGSGSGTGTGSGSGTGPGSGSGSGGGVGTGIGAEGQIAATGGGGGGGGGGSSGGITLREIVSEDTTSTYVTNDYTMSIVWGVVLGLATALAAGGMNMFFGFARRRRDGDGWAPPAAGAT